MKYTLQTEVLIAKDAQRNNKFDARVSQAPMRGFGFKLSIPRKLVKNNTIELARLPNKAKVTNIVVENTCTDIEYNITVSDTNIMIKSNSKKEVESFAPVEASYSSLVLTITKGTIKEGDMITGIIQFIGV